jgi:hypothetical protein
MAWQRKTPFGFEVRGGAIIVNAAEADAVREIFALYIGGGGYSGIAAEMERRGVRYHADNPNWNKHMVKRILENSRYVDAIVTASDFERVRELQVAKTANYREPSEAAKLIRSKLTAPRRMSDTELEARVTALMNELIERPELLAPADTEPQLSPAAFRLENELRRELNKPEFSEAAALERIFYSAAERYAALPDITQSRELAAMQAEIQDREPLAAFDAGLFRRAVTSVTLNPYGELALTLRNGAMLTENEIEETQIGEPAYAQQLT